MSFRIDQFALGFVVFTAIIITGLLMVSDINTKYSTSIGTEDFKDSMNLTNEMYDLGVGMKNKTLDVEVSGGDESWESMTKGSYSAVRLIRSTPGFFVAIVNDIAAAMHIPSFMVTLAFVAMTLALGFAIIAMIFRYKA